MLCRKYFFNWRCPHFPPRPSVSHPTYLGVGQAHRGKSDKRRKVGVSSDTSGGGGAGNLNSFPSPGGPGRPSKARSGTDAYIDVFGFSSWHRFLSTLFYSRYLHVHFVISSELFTKITTVVGRGRERARHETNQLHNMGGLYMEFCKG